MSYPSNSSKSNDIQAGHCIVPSQSLQSAIVGHQHKVACIDKVIRGDEQDELQAQLHAAFAAFASGQMSRTEYAIVKNRISEASHQFREREADFEARVQAGLAKSRDRFKEVYGYTDEEAEEQIRQGVRMVNMQAANIARSESCILQQRRRGRGY